MHSDGLFGLGGFVTTVYGGLNAGEACHSVAGIVISVLAEPTVAGDLSANFQLANPSQADQFYLGGQDIPLGGALGPSFSPFTLIDDAKTPGAFGFSSSTFIATNTSAAITVLRSNGVSGNVTIILFHERWNRRGQSGLHARNHSEGFDFRPRRSQQWI